MSLSTSTRGRGKGSGQCRSVAAGLAGLVAAACLASVEARAQEVHGSVTLYGWLPWIEADVASNRGGFSTTTSVSAGDALDALNFAFMAAGEVHYGRFGLLQDVVYSDLGSSGNLSGPFASTVGVDTTMLISTTALGYRAYDANGWLLEPYAGARYVGIETDVKVAGGGPLDLDAAAGVDLSWWDPVIGVRGRAPITQQLSAGGFVDIGGFGIGSDFSWEAFAGLDYAFTDRISTVVGFRYLSISYQADRAEIDLDTYGPVVGLALRF